MAAGIASLPVLGTLTGCGGSGKVVTLKWVTIGNGMPDNYDSWVQKVNEYTGEKIGVNIEMEVIPWGSWDDCRNGRRRNIRCATYKDNAISNYAVWDRELVVEYGLDISSLVEPDSLTETFEKLKADKNDYPERPTSLTSGRKSRN